MNRPPSKQRVDSLRSSIKPTAIAETLGRSVKGGAFRDNALNVKHALLDIRRAIADGDLNRVNGLAKTVKTELGPVIDWANR